MVGVAWAERLLPVLQSWCEDTAGFSYAVVISGLSRIYCSEK
jgi:hypothetical protein